MRTVRTAPYEPARREGLFALWERVWGSRMSDEEFEWWFERNPAGRRLISLAEDDGRVVGVAAMSSLRMVVDGEEQLVPFSVGLATDPDYRRRGILTALERANEEAAAREGAPLALIFPNAASGRIFTGALGWRELAGRRLWARLLRPSALARGGKAGQVRVEPLEHLNESEVDDLRHRVAPAYRNHVVRDAEHLTWRYLSSPRRYRCLGAFVDGRLEGIAVVGRTSRRRVSLAYLADLIAPAGAGTATAALLRRAIEEVRGGADALVALAPLPGAQRRAFVRTGFVPTPKLLRLLGKVLRPEARLSADRHAWYFTLGDADFF